MKSKIKIWISIVLLLSGVFIIAMVRSETFFYKVLYTWRKYVTPLYVEYGDNPLLQDKLVPRWPKKEVDDKVQNLETNKEEK